MSTILESQYEETLKLIAVLESEKNELKSQLHAQIEKTEIITAEASVFEKKYLDAESEAEECRESLMKAESEVESLNSRLDILERDNRNLIKENEDLQSQIEAQILNIDQLKAQWDAKEESLNQTIRDQKAKVKEQIAKLQDVQVIPTTEVESLEDSELKKAFFDMEKKCRALSAKIDMLTTENEEISSKAALLQKSTSEIRAEYQELEEVNRSLMEEAEGYQILLEQRTISGEFQSSAIMKSQESLGFGSSGTLADELGGGSVSSEAYEKKISALQQEIKALTLYIEKILPKVKIEDDFDSLSRTRKREGRLRELTNPPIINPRLSNELPPPVPSTNLSSSQTSTPRTNRKPMLNIGTTSLSPSNGPKSASTQLKSPLVVPSSPFLQTVAGFFGRAKENE
ncbi:hypothetical protein HK098_002318 [Nowakowskiella sp. JEL0407]|nr:hypothetical protein HK098_002318 [Nowakowskiella sp. JEL0407]